MNSPGCSRVLFQVSNEKKTLVGLGYMEDYTTHPNGDYFINHEIRIPIKQPEKNMMESTSFFVCQVG